jgi:hypothetical protein
MVRKWMYEVKLPLSVLQKFVCSQVSHVTKVSNKLDMESEIKSKLQCCGYKFIVCKDVWWDNGKW